jgi:TonB-dependent receptor
MDRPLYKKNMRVYLIVLFILGSYPCINAQSSLQGTIQDVSQKTGIEKATLTIKELNKTQQSGVNGSYLFVDLPKGTYTLEVKRGGFTTQTISTIELGENEIKTINVSLEPTSVTKGQVVINRRPKKDGTLQQLKVQHNLGMVSNGISGEEIRKAPDPKVSDVLKRIAGASIQDNKFVIVRGLTDRYNYAFLNGAPLPSSESDRKAFSFDIFPSNVLQGINIIKTAGPSLPGEFAGGIIQIATIDAPDKKINSIGLSFGYNAISTFRNFYTSGDSPLDFLGLGGKKRLLPSDIPGSAAYAALDVHEKARWAQKMNYNWSPLARTALPNSSLQYTLGNTYIFPNKQSFGYIAAYSYQNNQSFAFNTRREFEESASGVVQRMELNDSIFTQNVLNTVMLNGKYVLNANHSIQIKNLYSINSEDKVNVRNGVREMDNDPRQWEKATNFWYTQNKALSSQLIGTHTLDKYSLSWNLGYSDVDRTIPALRRVIYRKYSYLEDDPNEQYIAVIQNNGTIPTAAGNMFWSEANESIYSANYEIERSFKRDSSQITIKMGGMHAYRNRDFQARNFGFSKYNGGGVNFYDSLLLASPSSIFIPEHLGLMDNGRGGFKLDEATNVDDSYQANSLLHAGFLQMDGKWKKWLRLNGGLRVESYRQSFDYIEFGTNNDTSIVTTVVDFLPSANLIVSLSPRMNVRASSYRTVSRPEFRELAPFTFYNFVIDNIISGDPNLQRTSIMNYDLRYEYLIGNGQNFNVSGFYKSFTNPIELVNRTGTSGAPELFYTNVPGVKTLGAEVEYRFQLGFLSKKENHKLWDQLTVNLNGSIIKSRVNVGDSLAGQNEYTNGRPLQGQSPYLINAGLSYQSVDKKWAMSVAYNRVGQRIYIVGNEQEPSVWENGRNMLDFQCVRNFDDRFELRLNVRDALANQLVFFQDLNKNYKYDEGDNQWQTTTFGQTISLSLKYSF